MIPTLALIAMECLFRSKKDCGMALLASANGEKWQMSVPTSAIKVNKIENRRSTVNIGRDSAFVPESPVTTFPR